MVPCRRCCNFSFAGLKTAVNRLVDLQLEGGMQLGGVQGTALLVMFL